MLRNLQKYFFAGLAILLPFVITLYILAYIFRFFDNILGRFLNSYFKKQLGFYIPGIGIVLFILIILLFGFITTHFLKKRFQAFFENWFLKLPFIKLVYPSIKQIVNFLISKEKPEFQKVVLVEYPRRGVYSLGFVTNESMKIIQEKTGQEFLNVLIPSSPSPFTGFVIMAAKNELIFLDITVEDACKFIISDGVVNP
ncbi:MAG: DUF502 domain-containing protein [Candidatus Omnitrophota bacterium]|nr:DUF502 domain-containing protein [Candidatus Omnitrophota bacterium]